MDLSNTAAKNEKHKNSQAVQWLGLQVITAQGPGSIPDWEITIPQPYNVTKNRRKGIISSDQNLIICLTPTYLIIHTLHCELLK